MNVGNRKVAWKTTLHRKALKKALSRKVVNRVNYPYQPLKWKWQCPPKHVIIYKTMQYTTQKITIKMFIAMKTTSVTTIKNLQPQKVLSLRCTLKIPVCILLIIFMNNRCMKLILPSSWISHPDKLTIIFYPVTSYGSIFRTVYSVDLPTWSNVLKFRSQSTE